MLIGVKLTQKDNGLPHSYSYYFIIIYRGSITTMGTRCCFYSFLRKLDVIPTSEAKFLYGILESFTSKFIIFRSILSNDFSSTEFNLTPRTAIRIFISGMQSK